MVRFFSKKIIHFPVLESTNNYASKLISNSDPEHGLVIITDDQTQGKGQYGRIWESLPFKNLTFSIILKHQFLPVTKQFIVSISIATGIISSLRRWGLDAKIKWPNDIFIENKKLGGILIQNNIQGSFISSSIIGIGINVLQEKFPNRLLNPTSVILELDDNINGNTKSLIFKDILKSIEKFYQFIEIGNHDILIEKYNSYLYKRKVSSNFRKLDDNSIFSATIIRVNENGNIVLLKNEKENTYSFQNIRMLFE